MDQVQKAIMRSSRKFMVEAHKKIFEEVQKEEKMAKEKLSEKEHALESTIANLEKEFGKGTIMQMGKAPIEKIPAISTGCMSIDAITGIGGFPRGRVTEVYGPESGGKTTICLHTIAMAQKAGGIAAFVDAEHALDMGYAAKIGIDVPHLWVSQPDNGEQALQIVDELVQSRALDIIVIDSVAALVPRSEIEGDMGDASMAVQARLMSQAMRKLTSIISKSNTAVVFINQLRSKIGVMFGPSETTTGGNALKFYASMRIDIRRISSIKKGEQIVGNRTRVKIVKSKVSPPFKQTEIDIISPYGIDIAGDIIDNAVDYGVVKKSGAWYSYGEDRFQGKEKLSEVVGKDPIFLEALKTETLAAMQVPEPVKVVVAEEPIPHLV